MTRDDTVQPGAAAAADVDAPSVRWARWDLLLLAGITLVGAVVRLLAVEQWSFDAAEADTYRLLTLPLGGATGFFSTDESSYPVVYLAMRWLLDVGLLPGFTEGWIRLPFAFAGCLMVPLMALFCRPLFGRGVACLAALVLCVHPGHLAASQTAHPLVVAMTVAALVGIAAMRGWRWLSVGLVVLATACHPIGGLIGLGLLAIVVEHRGRLPRIPKWLLYGLAALALVLAPIAVLDSVQLSIAILVVLALLARAPLAAGTTVAMLLPLLAVSAWWWWHPDAAARATLAVLPAAVILASWLVVRFFRVLRVPEVVVPEAEVPEAVGGSLPKPSEPRVPPVPTAAVADRPKPRRRSLIRPQQDEPQSSDGARPSLLTRLLHPAGSGGPLGSLSLRRLLAGVPAMLLVGELATGSFLYMVVFSGGRPPWREVRNAAMALSMTHAGAELPVVSGCGAKVLRVYLRPSHWREPGRDPHPGVRVIPLPPAISSTPELLNETNVQLALMRSEWLQLQVQAARDPALAAQVAEFAVESVWPCAERHGDQSIYLLRRRHQD